MQLKKYPPKECSEHNVLKGLKADITKVMREVVYYVEISSFEFLRRFKSMNVYI